MGLTSRGLAALSLALAAAGCGPRAVYPVSGRAHYADGTPLVGGRVVIDAAGGKVGSWGPIAPDGTFEMGTHAVDDGVPPGRWRVSIEDAVTQPPPGHQGPWAGRPLAHRRFASPATSGLEFTVPEQPFWDITVERP